MLAMHTNTERREVIIELRRNAGKARRTNDPARRAELLRESRYLALRRKIIDGLDAAPELTPAQRAELAALILTAA